MTAREAVRAAAAANGWTFAAEDLFVDAFIKGRNRVSIQLDAAGRPLFALTPQHYLYGQDLPARILGLLA